MCIVHNSNHGKTEFICREVEACCDLLVSLCTCLEQLLSMREESVDGSLFPPGEHKAIGLFKRSAEINLQSFYGRCIGFHVSYNFEIDPNIR